MPVTVRAARTDDVPGIYALRVAAGEWMLARGWPQWHGVVSVERVTRQVDAGEWRVASAGGADVGALRLLRTDPAIWGDDDGDAVYVHSFVVDRGHAGEGIGAQILGWVDDEARRIGATRVRLDCVEVNPDIRRYYRGAGFAEVGRRAFDDPALDPVVLMEKRLPG
jgi:GNAT superfamily N-acetyltransferase